MLFRDGYVINPPRFLSPVYSISPFSRPTSVEQSRLAGGEALEGYLERRFGERFWRYTLNARGAIGEILKHLRIRSDENVAIFTTTGNAYISGCVTREIEKYCTWGRDVDSRTRAILINHEFGFPCENLDSFRAFGIPLIEDCAHSFFANNSEGAVGTVGDFVVFSFSKMFPIQLGGLLVSREPLDFVTAIDGALEDYIVAAVGRYVSQSREICERRRDNYQYLSERTAALGCSARFDMRPYHVPGVFMVRMGADVDVNAMKRFFQANGVESSVFYPEPAFFVPVHQNLERFDLDFLVTLLRVFMEGDCGTLEHSVG